MALFRFKVKIDLAKYAKRLGIDLPDDSMDLEVGGEAGDGLIDSCDASIGFVDPSLTSGMAACQATLQQCRAKNPLTCRYHGAKAISDDIEGFLRKHGVNGNVMVNLNGVFSNNLSAEVVVDAKRGDKKRIRDAMDEFGKLPGVCVDDDGNGHADVDIDQGQGYVGFEIDTLDPNAHARWAQGSSPAQNAGAQSSQTNQPQAATASAIPTQQTDVPATPPPQPAQQPTPQPAPPAPAVTESPVQAEPPSQPTETPATPTTVPDDTPPQQQAEKPVEKPANDTPKSSGDRPLTEQDAFTSEYIKNPNGNAISGLTLSGSSALLNTWIDNLGGDNKKLPPCFAKYGFADNDGIKADLLKRALDQYDKAYSEALGGLGANKTINGLLSGLKNGAMVGIYKAFLAKKSAAASAELPPGTKTPAEMRNGAAMAMAKLFGASLIQSPSKTDSPFAAKPETPEPPATSTETPAEEPPQEQPAPSTAPTQFGPNPALPHNFTSLPTGMNLSDFNSWKRGGGSTGLRIYEDPTTGKKYGVKHSGGMSGSGVNISEDALRDDYAADQLLRAAGLNAPDGMLVKHTDGKLYKITEWAENSHGIGGGPSNKNETDQLKTAYPVMALLYNMDSAQNGDNIRVDNKTGELIYVDNGSSFGNRAQGGVLEGYEDRDEADSQKSSHGVMELMNHHSQGMWKSAFGRNPTQDDVLKEAAKYDMESLAKMAALGKRGKKWKNLVNWAKSLDSLSAKYKSNNGTVSSTSAPATSAPAQTQQASTPQNTQNSPSGGSVASGGADAPSGSSSASGGVSAASSGTSTASSTAQWTQPTGVPTYNQANPQHAAVWGMANQSWKVPNYGGTKTPTNQLRNAQTIIAAIGNLAPSQLSIPTNLALGSIVKQGTFTANARGIGGTVTGANINRRGIRGVQKTLNSLLNPQGLKVQIQNNGNVVFSASNRSIASQALSAAGVKPSAGGQAIPTPTPQPAQTSSAQSNQKWQTHLNGLAANKPGNQQLNNAYNGISSWLNKAGIK